MQRSCNALGLPCLEPPMGQGEGTLTTRLRSTPLHSAEMDGRMVFLVVRLATSFIVIRRRPSHMKQVPRSQRTVRGHSFGSWPPTGHAEKGTPNVGASSLSFVHGVVLTFSGGVPRVSRPAENRWDLDRFPRGYRGRRASVVLCWGGDK